MKPPDPACAAYGHHRLRGVYKNVADDITRVLNKSPENRAAGDTFKSRLSALLLPQVLCLEAYRLAHWAQCRGWTRVARTICGINFLVHKVSITPDSCIGPGCLLPHPVGVCFCGRAGRDLTLYSLAVCGTLETSLGGPLEAAPSLGDRVSIGGRATVLGPVRVGSDVRMFAVKVVRDIPPGHTVTSLALSPHRAPGGLDAAGDDSR